MRLSRHQAAVVVDDEILLVRHTIRESGRSYWVPPGGGIEPGESGEECVLREVREETGLTVDVVRLLMTVKREASPIGYQEHRTYLCRVVAGEASAGYEPEDHGRYDISGVGWFSLADPAMWPAEITDDTRTTEFLTSVRDRLGYR